MKKLRRPKVKQQEGVVIPEVEKLLAEMTRIQNEALTGRQLFLTYELRVIELLKSYGLDTYDHGSWRGTPVSGSTAVYDWDGIKEAIGPRKWKQILGQPTPDPTKLEALIEINEVSADVIAPLITDKPSKTYVKITRRGDGRPT